MVLFHGLLHIMLAQGWTQSDYIADHTSGFETLQALVAEYAPQHVAQTISSYCPASKQPELKHAAVQINRTDLSANAT